MPAAAGQLVYAGVGLGALQPTSRPASARPLRDRRRPLTARPAADPPATPRQARPFSARAPPSARWGRTSCTIDAPDPAPPADPDPPTPLEAPLDHCSASVQLQSYEADAARFGAMARLFRSPAGENGAPFLPTLRVHNPTRQVATAGEEAWRGSGEDVSWLVGRGASVLGDKPNSRSRAPIVPVRGFTQQASIWRARTGAPKPRSAQRDHHEFAARVASFEAARALAAARGDEGAIRLSEAQLGVAPGAAGLSAWRLTPAGSAA